MNPGNSSHEEWRAVAARSGLDLRPGFRPPLPRLELFGPHQGLAAFEPQMGQPSRWQGKSLVLRTGEGLPQKVLQELLQLGKALDAASLDWPRILFDSGAEGWLVLRHQQPGVAYLALPSPCIARCNFCSKSLPSFVQATEKHWDPQSDQAGHLRFWLKHGGISPNSQIILGGNEPLSYSGLETLMEILSQHGHRPEVLSTTGWPLSPGRELRLSQLGLKKVELPLYGASGKTHDPIQRQMGAFEKTIDAIQRFQAAGISVAVHSLLMKQNCDHLSKLFHLVQSLGVSQWTLRLPHGLKEAPWVAWDLLASLSAVREAVSDLPTTSTVPIRVHLPPCTLEGSPWEQTENHPTTGRTLGLDLLPPEFGATCDSCSGKPVCPGLPGGYLSIFGETEIQPLR